ncbi:hypothetical protein ACFO1S_18075 [Cohnella boryungensis]|uniref:Uncharacterized protein n=1 Tax=Cohnella boryungensis TaxID=768479 RepID=A0ABV8SEG1_9BACL
MENNRQIYILQDVIVDGNASYTAGGQVRVESLNQTKIYLFIQYFDENDRFINDQVVYYPNLLNSYHELNISDTTPANAKR